MALQVRRGPTADRTSITPLVGELIWDTQQQTLYIGDGTTAGGVAAASYNDEQAQDAAASLLTGGSHTGISFTYNDVANTISAVVNPDLSNYQGSIRADSFIGSVFSDSSTLLLDGVLGSVNLDGTIRGNVVPVGDSVYDLGSSSNKFKDLYLSGSTIFLGDATITATGSTVNLPAGSTVNGVEIGTGSGIGDGVVAGSNYNINIISDDSTLIVDSSAGNFVGNLLGDADGNHTGTFTGTILATGSFDGDVNGSIFADDSTLLLDAISKEIYADVVDPFSSTVIVDVSTANIKANRLEITDIVTPVGDTFSLVANRFSLITTPTDTLLTINSEGPGVKSPISLEMSSINKNDNGELRLKRSRGTTGSESASVSDDRLYGINWYGHDGTDYVLSSQILGRVEGTVSSGIVPGRIDFITANSAGQTRRNMSIQSDQRVILNGRVFVQGSEFNLDSYNDGVPGGVTFALKRTRGTLNSETTVQNGDEILDISYLAYDGTDFIDTAKIKTVVDGTVSTGVVPSKFELQVTDATGNLQTALEISSGRTVTVPGDLNVNGFIDGNFIGSVYADDSSILINAANGSIQVANVDFVGQTGNTPSTPGSVDSWLEVTVNSATKYIPLYA